MWKDGGCGGVVVTTPTLPCSGCASWGTFSPFSELSLILPIRKLDSLRLWM